MKVKVTIEKVSYETQEIEMDEKFRICACPIADVRKIPSGLFAEAADTAAKILGIPLCGDDEGSDRYITAGECVDNGELIFEM